MNNSPCSKSLAMTRITEYVPPNRDTRDCTVAMYEEDLKFFQGDNPAGVPLPLSCEWLFENYKWVIYCDTLQHDESIGDTLEIMVLTEAQALTLQHWKTLRNEVESYLNKSEDNSSE